MRYVLLILSLCLPVLSLDAQTWTKKADVPSPQSGKFCFTIDGNVYIGGGYSNAERFAMYDTATNSWISKADVPNSLSGRSNGIGISINSKGYAGLGIDQAGISYFNDLWEYDPGTDTWTQKANLPGTGREGAGCFVTGNKLYVVGGASDVRTNEVWQYDPATDIWTRKRNYIQGPIIYPMSFSIAGKGYIACGFPGTEVSNKMYQYDPSDDRWTLKASFPGVARQQGIAFVLDGNAWCGLGRELSLFSPFQDMYRYDPLADTWATAGNFPGDARFGAVATSDGMTAWAGTGMLGTTDLEDWWQLKAHASAVNKMPAKSNVICYPNPAKGVLFISQPAGAYQPASYRILTADGRIILSGSVTNEQIDVSSLIPGGYIIELSNSTYIVRDILTIQQAAP